MNRKLIALSGFVAAVALAVPAFAEDSVNVVLAGKSPSAAYAAIAKAARAVCRTPAGMDIYNVYSVAECQKATVTSTIAKVGSPALSQYAASREALRLQLASN
ncbi:MAG TPA: hypothetical protein VL358_13305 [Caulobacteraceae bacterium]|nr:hypothetical protein [Caulobacteraceae bacterium]